MNNEIKELIIKNVIRDIQIKILKSNVDTIPVYVLEKMLSDIEREACEGDRLLTNKKRGDKKEIDNSIIEQQVCIKEMSDALLYSLNGQLKKIKK